MKGEATINYHPGTLSLLLSFALVLFYLPADSQSNTPDTPISPEIPSDTSTLIQHQGLPDMQFRVPEVDPEDRMLLYREEYGSNLLVDKLYYVEDEGHITHKITSVEPKKDNSKTEGWIRETLNDVKGTIKELKRQKEALNKNIASLPGFNYFDRVNMISDTLELGLGKKDTDQTLSTLRYEPDERTLNLTFRIPFS